MTLASPTSPVHRPRHRSRDEAALHASTLGPPGSSSEQAVRYLGRHMASIRLTYRLEDSFEAVLALLQQQDIDLAVVPHAYAGIHRFYMMPELKLLRLFVMPTPVYGLAVHPQPTPGKGKPVLVTHPAPLPILRHLVDDPSQFDVQIVGSTSVAARLVRDGKADWAITNEVALTTYGLEFTKVYGPIVMSWSVFTHRDANLDGVEASVSSWSCS